MMSSLMAGQTLGKGLYTLKSEYEPGLIGSRWIVTHSSKAKNRIADVVHVGDDEGYRALCHNVAQAGKFAGGPTEIAVLESHWLSNDTYVW